MFERCFGVFLILLQFFGVPSVFSLCFSVIWGTLVYHHDCLGTITILSRFDGTPKIGFGNFGGLSESTFSFFFQTGWGVGIGIVHCQTTLHVVPMSCRSSTPEERGAEVLETMNYHATFIEDGKTFKKKEEPRKDVEKTLLMFDNQAMCGFVLFV